MDVHFEDGHVVFYEYDPSEAAAGVFIGLFSVCLLAHLSDTCRFRSPFFIPMIIGCIMEIFGYYGRFWGAHSERNGNFGAYVLQSFMLLLGPIFMAATMYMCAPRIACALKRRDLLAMPKGCASKVFIIGDITCLLIQVAALGLKTTTDAAIQEIGRKVVIVGLVVQILLTFGYLLVIWNFYARMHNLNTSMQPPNAWARYLVALMITCVCLTLRNLVRTVEFAQGSVGFVASNEVFVYLFDGALMLLLAVLLLVFHPGRLRRAMNKLDKRSVEMGHTRIER